MMRIYFLAIAAIFVSCSDDKPVDDRFAFKPGNDSLFYFTLDIVDSSGALPGNAAMKKQSIEFTLQKLAENDTTITMRMVIERLAITQPGITLAESKKGSVVVLPAGTIVTVSTDDTIEIDSHGAFSGTPDYYRTWDRILLKLKGDSLLVVMNNRGEVQQVTGFERITDKIARETAIDRRTVRQCLDLYAGNESTRDLLNQLFFYLPGRKIVKGDNWVKNVTTIARAPVKFSYLIAASEVDMQNDVVQMNVRSEVSARTSEEGRQYAEGNVTGIITASYSTGMPNRIELTQVVVTHTDQYDVVNKRTISTPRF